MKKYDVVVVGAGSGGQTAAYTLCEYGLKVAVVENSPTPGGICALAGCQAKKYFYEATETVARSRHMMGKGIVQPAEADWAAVLARKNAFTDPIPAGTRTGLKGSGIDFIEGTAAFQDPDTLVASGQSLKARFFILATGARPMPLTFPGADQLETSTAFLARGHLPPRVVFVGGGFISFEFAHFAARLGPAASTTILEVAPRPLGPFDSEMVDALVEASRSEGINIHTDVKIEAVAKNGSEWVVKTTGDDFEADLVVHGAGRVAAIDDLNLGSGGVLFTQRGITVDAEMRTSNPRVFAVGDCAATLQLARVADYEGYVATKNILAAVEGGGRARLDYRNVPTVLFTYPQYAMVGATEDALKVGGVRYYKNSDKNIGWPTYKRVGLSHAAFKVLVDADNHLLGAHIVSDNASGLINTFKQAMIDGRTVEELFWDNVMSPYPSRESDIIYMLKPFFEDELLEGL
jgi:glutathione reductase (NADPH)